MPTTLSLWCYDTNTNDIKHKQVAHWNHNVSFAEFALIRLCADNYNTKDHGDPLGPVAFKSDDIGCWLVSAWCSGRQWFYMVELWTEKKFTKVEALTTLSKILLSLGLEETNGEED